MLDKPSTTIATGVFALVVAALLVAGSKEWAERGQTDAIELIVTIVGVVLAAGGLVAVGLGLRLKRKRKRTPAPSSEPGSGDASGS